MNLRILVARRISKRLEREARGVSSRFARPSTPRNFGEFAGSKSAREALRLYAAWAAKRSNVIQTRAEDWYQAAALPQASP